MMTAVTSYDNHDKRTMNIKLFIKISCDDCHISTEHLRLVSIDDETFMSVPFHVYTYFLEISTIKAKLQSSILPIEETGTSFSGK